MQNVHELNLNAVNWICSWTGRNVLLALNVKLPEGRSDRASRLYDKDARDLNSGK